MLEAPGPSSVASTKYSLKPSKPAPVQYAPLASFRTATRTTATPLGSAAEPQSPVGVQPAPYAKAVSVAPSSGKPTVVVGGSESSVTRTDTSFETAVQDVPRCATTR